MTVHEHVTIAISPNATGEFQVFHIGHTPGKPPELLAVSGPIVRSQVKCAANELRKLADDLERIAGATS